MSAYLDEQYFEWLYSQVCSVETSQIKSYRNLLYLCYQMEYVWLIPNDDNRLEDGKYLRYEFLELLEISKDKRDQWWMELGCSILEFLVALARRLEFETDIATDIWFLELIDNLGLAKYNDRTRMTEEKKQDIEDTINRMVWRTYRYNGRGGLFPLDHPEEDQREVEIWYQLSAYINERELV